MALADITADAVLKALNEFDEVGRDAFLAKYGFDKAKSYFLVHQGRRYDSKAVVGAAHGYSGMASLRADQFSGGKATVARLLAGLGFEVFGAAQIPSPLVLVENERTAGGHYDHWKDVTGERYQYPNQYKNRVVEGRPFVYYRGTRRAGGGRGTPEYFGHGVIGAVHLDPDTDESSPKKDWKWVCEIAEYSPFESPVPFKKADTPYEDIAKNLWSVAVRDLPQDAYDKILQDAGVSRPLPGTAPSSPELAMPPINQVAPEGVDPAYLLPPRPPRRTSSGGSGRHRRSAYSKRIGDRGERIVLSHLERLLDQRDAKTLRWVAAEGETPGWDIEYTSGGQLWAVEVKATSGPAMPSVELTANEWASAKALGERYRLALVARTLTKAPEVGFIDDVVNRVEQGEFGVEPLSWRLERAPVAPASPTTPQ